MGEKKEYRSAIRSRRLIREAFLELLRRKPYEKITVTDIAAAADINRSTFYAHYTDVRGLVEEIVGEILHQSIALANNLDMRVFLEDPMPFLQELSSYSTRNRELYELLSRSDFAHRHMEQLKHTLIEAAIRSPAIPEHIRTSMDFRIHISFFIGGLLTLYVMWLQGELECSDEDITKQMSLVIQNNAALYLNWS
ncbi:MAG: TetR/AcrR family transcriptional regulator [Ruminococcaceae bacterium]|nr:TetR/AcrR family transcriptional regulator [Oscillospiraceae bacterium]